MLWAISPAPCYVTVESGHQHSLLTEATDWLLGQLHLSNHIPAIVVSRKGSPMPSLLPKCLLVPSLSFLSASFIKTRHLDVISSLHSTSTESSLPGLLMEFMHPSFMI